MKEKRVEEDSVIPGDLPGALSIHDDVSGRLRQLATQGVLQ